MAELATSDRSNVGMDAVRWPKLNTVLEDP